MIKNKDEKIEKIYISLFNDISSEIFYLVIIGTKILIDNINEKTVGYDEKRLYDEFVYYKYYSHMEEEYLLGFFIPIILANKNTSATIKAVTDLSDKLTKFYKCENKKYSYILDSLCYEVILKNLMKNHKIELSFIFEDIKLRLLEFNIESKDKKEIISFQKEKIKYIYEIHILLNEIGEKEFIEKSKLRLFEILIKAFNDEDAENKGEKLILNSFYFLLNKNYSEKSTFRTLASRDVFVLDKMDFVKSMASYLIKIRNMKINKKLYNGKSSPRKFLELKEGESILDPILNMTKLVSKEKLEKEYKVIVSTKTGYYSFVYKIKQ